MNAPRLFGPDRTYERWRWQIFGITWLAYAGFYFTRKSFSIAKIQLRQPESLALTDQQMSWIDGGFLVAYALGMMFWGVCGDRFGTRKVILVGMIGSVASAFAMGAATSAPLMFLFFTLQGVFQSTGWAPLSKNLTNFFSQQERGVVMGFWCTNYSLGGYLAGVHAGWLGDAWGWRTIFVVQALILLAILILFCAFQKNRPEDVGLPPIEVYHGEPPPAIGAGSPGAGETTNPWRVIVEVIRTPMILLLAVIYFCLKPTRYAILFWGPAYINERLGYDMTDSGLLSGLFELAGPAGVIIGGVLSDKLFGARRMPVAVISLALLGVLLCFLDPLSHVKFMLGPALFLLGVLTYAPDSLVSGTAVVDFGTRLRASTASGLVNGAGSVGAIVGGTIPGFFREQWGWHGVFTFLAGAVFVAALLLLPKWNALPQARSG